MKPNLTGHYIVTEPDKHYLVIRLITSR